MALLLGEQITHLLDICENGILTTPLCLGMEPLNLWLIRLGYIWPRSCTWRLSYKLWQKIRFKTTAFVFGFARTLALVSRPCFSSLPLTSSRWVYSVGWQLVDKVGCRAYIVGMTTATSQKLTKTQALARYDFATTINQNTPEWAIRQFFPALESLVEFCEAVGQITWPEYWGASPWDRAFSIAHMAKGSVITSAYVLSSEDHAIAMRYRSDSGLSTDRLSNGSIQVFRATCPACYHPVVYAWLPCNYSFSGGHCPECNNRFNLRP